MKWTYFSIDVCDFFFNEIVVHYCQVVLVAMQGWNAYEVHDATKVILIIILFQSWKESATEKQSR